MNLPGPGRIMNQGLIMKVLTSWKKVQRLVESGEAAGIAPFYKLQFAATSVINMYDVTRHGANL